MDRIANFRAIGLQHLGQFPQGVLGLGYSQAVTGHKHNPLGIFQGHGAFLSAATGDPRITHLLTTAGRLGYPQGTTEEHRNQGAIHGRAHHLGEDQARRTHHGAGHDQQLAAHHEAGGRGRHTGIGVEQRNHHRHVGAADGEGHAHPQQAGGHHQHPQGNAGGIAWQKNRRSQAKNGQADIHHVANRSLGPARGIEPTLQLGHGHN